MTNDFNIPDGREPLIDYPWNHEVERLLVWAKEKDKNFQCFLFDVVMSLAYIDSTSGLIRFIEYCPNTPDPYNMHLGFINLCSPCYEYEGRWTYQKATKPQSGALGKLSSEVVLRFIQALSDNLISVKSIGGVNSIDAVLKHSSGITIIAEVKSAPLITYPVILRDNISKSKIFHESPDITNTQFLEFDTALYLHGKILLSLGKPKDKLWPFKGAVDFITNKNNEEIINQAAFVWKQAKDAYINKDKKNPMYYLANASGNPPKVAKDSDGWPNKESISDSKTSAGMDRTDDIKKGIYQSIKIGTLLKSAKDLCVYKTAIISNLPAYRHGKEYVDPFIEILWGVDSDIQIMQDKEYIDRKNLSRVFDYIITIDSPVLRGLEW